MFENIVSVAFVDELNRSTTEQAKKQREKIVGDQIKKIQEKNKHKIEKLKQVKKTYCSDGEE